MPENRNNRTLLIFMAVCGIIWLAASCSLPSNLFFEPPPVTPPALAGTPEIRPTLTRAPTETPVPPTPFPCAYAWANKDLPDETAVVQEALKKAGLGNIEAALSAYGENCLDTVNDTIVSFSAMQTDFFFSIPVKDLNDRAEMGGMAEKVLRVVEQFPPGKVPGPNPGYVALVYSDGKDEVRLWFQIKTGLSFLGDDLRGEALFDALQPKP